MEFRLSRNFDELSGDFQMNNSKHSIIRVIDYLFIVFSLMPFILPNPIISTNIQPYSTILGTVILFLYFGNVQKSVTTNNYFIIGVFTVLVAVIVLLAGGIKLASLRGVFNYYSAFVVPLATVICFQSIGKVPEKLIKAIIMIWIGVSAIQMFIFRGFMAWIIAGAHVSYSGYRGVIGLASEPSFLGIACFYFLHLASRFQTKKTLYFILITVCGVVFAQSTMGIVFIAAFYAIYLLEHINTPNGYRIWGISIVSVIVFVLVIDRYFAGTRVARLFQSFFKYGISRTTELDASAHTRWLSITKSIGASAKKFFLPMGYGSRIGSGVGGFLCELGLFSFPILFSIFYIMAKTFRKKCVRFIYFFVIIALLCNNTQLGNPLLLFVMGLNMYDTIERQERLEE